MKIYCQSCGNATDYSLSKPKFCASCGTGFQLLATNVTAASPKTVTTTIPAAPKRPAQRVIVSPEEDTDDENFILPVVTEPISFELKGSGVKKEKIGEVANTRDDGYRRDRPKSKAKSKSAALKQFSREAGPCDRSKPIEVGGDE